jgi:hypothetical protein
MGGSGVAGVERGGEKGVDRLVMQFPAVTLKLRSEAHDQRMVDLDRQPPASSAVTGDGSVRGGEIVEAGRTRTTPLLQSIRRHAQTLELFRGVCILSLRCSVSDPAPDDDCLTSWNCRTAFVVLHAMS